MDDKDLLISRIEILEQRNKIALGRTAKYKKMTYAQVLQCPENKKRLQMCEIEQEQTFQKIIKKRHPELYHDWKNLFAEYFIDFLKGKVLSINDFLYKDRLEVVNKRELK